MPIQADLIRVVQRLSFCHDLDAILAVLRETARSLLAADGIAVILREDDRCHYAEEDAIGPLWKGHRFAMQECISGWCMLHRSQVAIADIYTDARIPRDLYETTFVRSLVMVPIRSEEPLGAIGAYWARVHQATKEEINILQSLADSTAIAFANVQLVAARRQLLERLLSVQEDERRRIARDLHDDIGQTLGALLLGLGGVESATTLTEARSRVADVRQTALSILEATRRLARGLRPALLEDFGLVPALEQLIAEVAPLTAVAFDLQAEIPEHLRLPAPVEVALYRIAQEAVSNILKHAGAKSVRLVLSCQSETILLKVADDGCGFDPTEPLGRAGDPSFGLTSMKERASLLLGTLSVISRPGEGSVVQAALPMFPKAGIGS